MIPIAPGGGPRVGFKLNQGDENDERALFGPALGAGGVLGGGPGGGGAGWSAARADGAKIEFPVSSDPSELPQVWPEQAGVDSSELVKLSQWIRDSKLDIRRLVIVKDR